MLIGIVKGHMLFKQSAHFLEVLITLQNNVSKKVRKEKEKSRAVDVSSYRQMERTPRKCFKCESEHHMIAKYPNPVCFNEKVNYACDSSKNNSDCEIYASMARMSSNDEWKNHGKTEN